MMNKKCKARAKATCISPILKWKNPIWEGITSMWDLCGNFPTIMWEFFPHMPKNPHKSHMLISYRKYVGFFYKGFVQEQPCDWNNLPTEITPCSHKLKMMYSMSIEVLVV